MQETLAHGKDSPKRGDEADVERRTDSAFDHIRWDLGYAVCRQSVVYECDTVRDSHEANTEPKKGGVLFGVGRVKIFLDADELSNRDVFSIPLSS